MAGSSRSMPRVTLRPTQAVSCVTNQQQRKHIPNRCNMLDGKKTGGLYAAPGTNNNFCGPTAIAAITGLPIEFIEARVVAYRKKNPTPRRVKNRGAIVRAMFFCELEPIMRELGWRVIESDNHKYMSDC